MGDPAVSPTREVRCASCGTVNRLPLNYPLAQRPLCARCKAPIAELPAVGVLRATVGAAKTAAKIAPRFIPLAVLVGGFCALIVYVDRLPKQPAAPVIREAVCEVPSPPTGLYRRLTADLDVSRLTIDGVSSNAFVVLANPGSGRVVRQFYIRAGETLEARAPLGLYALKLARGDAWCGPDRYFGSRTSFAQADDLFDFKEDGHWTVTLIPQRFGNLATTTISRAQFSGEP